LSTQVNVYHQQQLHRFNTELNVSKMDNNGGDKSGMYQANDGKWYPSKSTLISIPIIIPIPILSSKLEYPASL
jgi:hypothetical protein